MLKKVIDWTHAENAIQGSKSMLWALETLRIFDVRLGESLDKVREARDKMRTYLSHVSLSASFKYIKETRATA